ncbi:MAG: Hpt domain-containing protein [Pararhodobacter sp.]|nr:Hpt domain-containing protein [Pararhodobacter sp.]
MSVDNNDRDESWNFPESNGFDPEYLEEFVSVLGAERAEEWLERLDELIASAFGDNNDNPEEIRRAAHSMVSQAGSLGFTELAALCSKLERAISADENYIDEFRSVQQEAGRVSNTVIRIRDALVSGTRSAGK